MIFPVWTLKSVKNTFGMEYDQRVIINFFWNERIDARHIADRLYAQFGEHIYQLRTIRFWIAEALTWRWCWAAWLTSIC
jgi:hypothetical protein